MWNQPWERQMTLHGREVRLAHYPSGIPTADDFVIANVNIAEPGQDEVLVRNLYTSVDPGQRGLMNGGESYVATYQVGAPLTGRTIGRVAASNATSIPVGSLVFHRLGWREFAVVPASAVRLLPEASDVADHLGVLGHPGLTAWLGISDVAHVKPGDVVLVSSAAGAVGGAAGQLAKIRGAKRVIGTVGSDAKADHIRGVLGFDVALNYRAPEFAKQLAAAAPAGIDVFFDNVGGEQLDMTLPLMGRHGRIVICGSISTYNDVSPRPITHFDAILSQRLRVEGFLVYDHELRMPAFLEEVRPLVESGRIVAPKTIFEGLDQAPDAFVSLFHGGSLGKTLVRLAAESG
jgi:NADPH-dependent curcumin reductase CurA